MLLERGTFSFATIFEVLTCAFEWGKIQNQIIFYISRCVLSWVSCEILRETQKCNLKSRRRGKILRGKISKQNCMILRKQKATLKLLLVLKQGFGVPCWPSTFWIRSFCQNSPQAHFLCCWVLLELNILTKADLISFLYSTILRIFCSFTDITWLRFCAYIQFFCLHRNSALSMCWICSGGARWKLPSQRVQRQNRRFCHEKEKKISERPPFFPRKIKGEIQTLTIFLWSFCKRSNGAREQLRIARSFLESLDLVISVIVMCCSLWGSGQRAKVLNVEQNGETPFCQSQQHLL